MFILTLAYLEESRMPLKQDKLIHCSTDWYLLLCAYTDLQFP